MKDNICWQLVILKGALIALYFLYLAVAPHQSAAFYINEWIPQPVAILQQFHSQLSFIS